MNNNWKKIWTNRSVQLPDEISLDQLISLNGFDTGAGKVNAKDWQVYANRIADKLNLKNNDSVYEVGCGSGAFLYSLSQNKKLKVGGIDYGSGLIETAKKVLPKGDFVCEEASKLNIDEQYDYVISNSVFHYFSLPYAENIIELMLKKTNNSVCILEIPDKSQKQASEDLRRDALSIDEYEKKYNGLEHTYYEKKWFEKIAFKNRVEFEIINGLIPNYSQNAFRFGCIMRKL